MDIETQTKQLIRDHLSRSRQFLVNAEVRNKKILIGAVNAFNKQQKAYLKILISLLGYDPDANIYDYFNRATEVDHEIYFKNNQQTDYFSHHIEIQNDLRNAYTAIENAGNILRKTSEDDSLFRQISKQQFVSILEKSRKETEFAVFYQKSILDKKLDYYKFVKDYMFEVCLDINRKANFDLARGCNEELGRLFRTQYSRTKKAIKSSSANIGDMLKYF